MATAADQPYLCNQETVARRGSWVPPGQGKNVSVPSRGGPPGPGPTARTEGSWSNADGRRPHPAATLRTGCPAHLRLSRRRHQRLPRGAGQRGRAPGGPTAGNRPTSPRRCVAVWPVRGGSRRASWTSQWTAESRCCCRGATGGPPDGGGCRRLLLHDTDRGRRHGAEGATRGGADDAGPRAGPRGAADGEATEELLTEGRPAPRLGRRTLRTPGPLAAAAAVGGAPAAGRRER